MAKNGTQGTPDLRRALDRVTAGEGAAQTRGWDYLHVEANYAPNGGTVLVLAQARSGVSEFRGRTPEDAFAQALAAMGATGAPPNPIGLGRVHTMCGRLCYAAFPRTVRAHRALVASAARQRAHR